MSRKIEFFLKLPKKLKFFENLPGKIEIYCTQIHDPQISNQIDATGPGVSTPSDHHSQAAPFFSVNTKDDAVLLEYINMGLDYPLRMTGTLFPSYFSRTCINLLLFNRSVAQLYLGVLIPCVVVTIFDSLNIVILVAAVSAGIFLIKRFID